MASAQNKAKFFSKQTYLILAVALVFVICLLLYIKLNESNTIFRGKVDTYEECIAAGNPILKSYPEVCVTNDDQTFVRQLSEEEKRQLQQNLPENQ